MPLPLKRRKHKLKLLLEETGGSPESTRYRVCVDSAWRSKPILFSERNGGLAKIEAALLSPPAEARARARAKATTQHNLQQVIEVPDRVVEEGASPLRLVL